MRTQKFLFNEYLLYLLCIVLIFVGCTPSSLSPTVSDEESSLPTSTVDSILVNQTPSILVTLEPIETTTSDIAPTSPATSMPQSNTTQELIQIPTPIGSGAKEQALWLYETNNDCELPCWWGIIPGETEWQNAEMFLRRFDQDIYQASTGPESVFYDVSIPLPLDIFSEEQTKLAILVQDNIVQRIDTRVSIGPTPSDYLAAYSLSAFLTTYGQPSQVFLSTFSTPFENGELPFIVVLFYQEQGIATLFYDNGVTLDDMVQGCPQQSPAKALSLWNSSLNFMMNPKN